MADKFNIRKLEDAIRINEHALEDECKEQPHLFYEVAKELAFAVSDRDAAKTFLTTAKAEADGRARNRLERNGEKVTEKSVEALIPFDDAVVEAQNNFLNRNADVGKLTALKEAFEQRKDMLKNLTTLYVASYYGEVGGGRPTDVRDINAARGREGMAKARRERARMDD